MTDTKVIISENNKSKAKSMEGFKASKNFKSALKNAAFVMIPALITELVANNVISTGIAALIGPMILKSVEYYFKKYD